MRDAWGCRASPSRNRSARCIRFMTAASCDNARCRRDQNQRATNGRRASTSNRIPSLLGAVRRMPDASCRSDAGGERPRRCCASGAPKSRRSRSIPLLARPPRLRACHPSMAHWTSVSVPCSTLEFDVVVISNLLHLQADPSDCSLAPLSVPPSGGTLVVNGPNFDWLATLAERISAKVSAVRSGRSTPAGCGRCALRSPAAAGSKARVGASRCPVVTGTLAEGTWVGAQARSPWSTDRVRLGAARTGRRRVEPRLLGPPIGWSPRAIAADAAIFSTVLKSSDEERPRQRANRRRALCSVTWTAERSPPPRRRVGAVSRPTPGRFCSWRSAAARRLNLESTRLREDGRARTQFGIHEERPDQRGQRFRRRVARTRVRRIPAIRRSAPFLASTARQSLVRQAR